MSYNKNRNYKQEIDEAVRSGNYVLAGSLERERNAKIAGEGLNYAQTNDYTPYLERDYGREIEDGIRRGDYGAVSEASKYREQKTHLPEYSQYRNDDISRKAQSFSDIGSALNQKFSYDNGSAQLAARQKEIDALVDGLKNYKKFEYNPETDPLYAALAAQYTRNGQRAMKDTTAEISARTGGMASSYAAAAGNQAYANYMSELGDRIPELSQLAYQMYDNEYNRKQQQAQMAQNRYESDLARYQNERNFAYNQFADNRNMAYNQMRDMTEGERYADETKYNRDMDARQWNYGVKQDEYAKQLEKAQTLAAAGDFSGFKALGYSDAQIDTMKYAYAAQNAPKAKGGGGKPKEEESYVEQMLSLGSDNAVEEWLIRNNFSENEKVTLRGLYAEAKKKQEIIPTSQPRDPEEGANGKNYTVVYRRATNMEGKKSREEIQEYLNEAYNRGDISEQGLIKLIEYFEWE